MYSYEFYVPSFWGHIHNIHECSLAGPCLDPPTPTPALPATASVLMPKPCCVPRREPVLALQVLTQAKREVIVSGRTLLTVVPLETGLAGAAAWALLTVIRVLRVTAASWERSRVTRDLALLHFIRHTCPRTSQAMFNTLSLVHRITTLILRKAEPVFHFIPALRFSQLDLTGSHTAYPQWEGLKNAVYYTEHCPSPCVRGKAHTTYSRGGLWEGAVALGTSVGHSLSQLWANYECPPGGHHTAVMWTHRWDA